jgi:cytochrome c
MNVRMSIVLMVIGACTRADARVIPGGDANRGKAAIVATGCGACHVIDGIDDAHGEVGPPLSGIAKRSVIGGALPNTPENIMRWIEDAPSISPHTAMPNLGVTPDQARDMAAYLYAR